MSDASAARLPAGDPIAVQQQESPPDTSAPRRASELARTIISRAPSRTLKIPVNAARDIERRANLRANASGADVDSSMSCR